jgi:hypothetical protein
MGELMSEWHFSVPLRLWTKKPLKLTRELHGKIEVNRGQSWLILKISNRLVQVIEMSSDEDRHWRILGEYHNVRNVTVSSGSDIFLTYIDEGTVIGATRIERAGLSLEVW